MLTLLIVEDERMVREVVTAVLERSGFKVIPCSGGEHALRTLETENVDVVLLDMELPGMHGEDVLRRIRELRPALPIVLTSGHERERYVQSLIEPKVTFVQKPYQPREIAALVRSLANA